MQYDGPAATPFVGRMIGAARLNADIYEEVEHDRNATGQAAIVVVGTSLAAGIGSIGEVGALGLVFLTLLRLPVRALLSPLMFNNVGNIGLPVALVGHHPGDPLALGLDAPDRRAVLEGDAHIDNSIAAMAQ